ncbi:hypothetical protein MKZ38_009274 [Zalerion maritima]|uniref:Uncharacterized protein n=1 Tax=Zalerion maritima TaxID=339359 RepID=A0AAD5RGX2_9PEZI|nr:hypothetical protein MKZ38_009274 [Zalerion maritima]
MSSAYPLVPLLFLHSNSNPLCTAAKKKERQRKGDKQEGKCAEGYEMPFGLSSSAAWKARVEPNLLGNRRNNKPIAEIESLPTYRMGNFPSTAGSRRSCTWREIRWDAGRCSSQRRRTTIVTAVQSEQKQIFNRWAKARGAQGVSFPGLLIALLSRATTTRPYPEGIATRTSFPAWALDDEQ